LLVHICCSVDSHFFLQKLQKLYPEKKLIGYFYDPNIHPYSEYCLRLLDVQRSCQKLGIELLEGEYDFDGWCEAVRGLENEPEKGKRCSVCFDDRLENTAKKALELGIKEITTTLFTSPKKSFEQLKKSAKMIEQKYSLEVQTPDFRINGGTAEQFALAKKDKLYHQNYCGCLFALQAQRKNQKRLQDELMCPITKQVLPSSIESRIKLYKQIIQLENQEKLFELKRENFLNYRLLRAYVKDSSKKSIESYFLFYSMMNRAYTKGKIESICDNVGFFNKENILFVSLEKINQICTTKYTSIRELMNNPLSISQELHVRRILNQSEFVTSNSIIILEKLEKIKYEIYLCSELYQDSREKIFIPSI
jgi:epoxyqueuosine reductase